MSGRGRKKEMVPSVVQRVEDLDVFQLAHRLTLKVYDLTARFPKSETFALTSQLRRASVSICSNMAEGAGRDSRSEFHRFVSIAKGSAREVAYQLVLARDLHYISEEKWALLTEMTDHIQRMLSRLMTSLKETT